MHGRYIDLYTIEHAIVLTIFELMKDRIIKGVTAQILKYGWNTRNY